VTTIVLCQGTFDLLHEGHRQHLLAAKELGDHLVVAVSSDDVVRERKPGRPIQPIGERVAALRALRCVDEVWVCTSYDGSDAILLFCPTYYVKGNDYSLKTLTPGEINACHRVGAQIIFTNTEKRSTTALIERCKAA
jgi:rfaE bifunctional protein nucleotidyltransferase chain/domain